MKSFKRFALVPAVALLVFASGCNMVDTGEQSSQAKATIVFNETFCVQFVENRTTGTFASAVVADQFQEDILAFFAANGIPLECVTDLALKSTEIVCVSFSGLHSFDVTSEVTLKRTDIADGPQLFIKSQTLRVPDECNLQPPMDGAYRPRLDRAGVQLANRALNDLVQGGSPVLIVEMVATDVDPEPSVSDPLVFTWDACLKVIATVDANCAP